MTTEQTGKPQEAVEQTQGAPAPQKAEAPAWPTAPPQRHLFYRFVAWSFRVFGRLWLNADLVHLDRFPMTGPVLVLPTHTSFIDPPLVGGNLPREAHYLAREGILKAPLIGLMVRNLNTHPIRQGASDREAIRVCRSVLREGHPLVFFPEGTRSRDGRLGPIRPGFAMILDGLEGVPYIPVVAQDTFYSLPRGSFFPRRHKARIVFGHPTTLPKRLEGERTRDYFDRCAQDLEARLRELGAK